MSGVTLHIDPQTLYENGFVSLNDSKRLNEAGYYNIKDMDMRLNLGQIAELRKVSYQRLRNFMLCDGFKLDPDNKLSMRDALRLDLTMITGTAGHQRKRTALKNLKRR